MSNEDLPINPYFKRIFRDENTFIIRLKFGKFFDGRSTLYRKQSITVPTMKKRTSIIIWRKHNDFYIDTNHNYIDNIKFNVIKRINSYTL